MSATPSLFLAHGAPDLPLGDHSAKRFLLGLAPRLPELEAILIVSAHWEAAVPTLGTAPRPDTVHDFGGFPHELYDLRYPAATSPALIERAEALLAAAGLAPARDPRRGFDHGAWVPLSLAFPEATTPVVQLSLQRGGSAERHLEIGRALAPLRREGVLIVGSGATVHNLRALAPEGAPAPGWAEAFDAWTADAVARRDAETLAGFPRAPVEARRAHPTPEHFLPLLVAFAAGGGEGRRIHHSYSYGSIGMASYAFGAAAETAALAEAADAHAPSGSAAQREEAAR
ncbi:MAG: class III extradiol ring-cleavage dioxygenase [Pseudomonadota bacterium]